MNTGNIISNVAVMITTRNRVKDLLVTIERCLDIGIEQNQIFITDDNSTDGTAHTLDRTFPSINVTVNDLPRGYIPNRNTMLKLISYPFILSLDDDSNLMSKSDLEEALLLLNSKDEYAVFGFNPIEQIEEPPAKETYSNSIYIDKAYIGCGHIVKKKYVDLIGYYPESLGFYGEENDFAVRCFMHGLYVVKKDDLIVHHRIDKVARKKIKYAQGDAGQYGILWRSKMSMRNRLFFIFKYYPLAFLPYYLVKSLLGHFYLFHLKESTSSSFWNAIAETVKGLPEVLKQRKPLPIGTFVKYKNLPSRIKK